MPYWDNGYDERCPCGSKPEDPMVSPLCYGCWCYEQAMRDRQYPEPDYPEPPDSYWIHMHRDHLADLHAEAREAYPAAGEVTP